MTEKNERNMKLSNGLSEQLAQKELENTQILNSLEENQTMNSSMCSRLGAIPKNCSRVRTPNL